MDIMQVIETFGLPVAMVIALGFYVSKKDKSAEKQNQFIQKELMDSLAEDFKRIEMIIIGLINQQKKMQIEQKGIEKSYKGLVDIISKLMHKNGNGLKDKLLKFIKEN